MAKFKGTRGICEINSRASRNVRCNGKTIANCSSGQDGENEEEEIENAKLIADAFNTINKCDLFPSELLKQRNEILEALHWVAGFGKNGEIHDKMIVNKCLETLKKVTE